MFTEQNPLQETIMELATYNHFRWTINHLSICEELCDPTQVPRVQKLMRYMKYTLHRLNNPENIQLTQPNAVEAVAA